MAYAFGARSLKALEGVEPKLVAVLHAAIATSPFDFTIVEGVRTSMRQRELYAQGRTAKGPIVTYADGIKKKSNHQPKADGYGHAVDLAPWVNGAIDWNNEARFIAIARHIKDTAKKLGVPITWGGDWVRPVDKPHFELKQ